MWPHREYLGEADVDSASLGVFTAAVEPNPSIVVVDLPAGDYSIFTRQAVPTALGVAELVLLVDQTTLPGTEYRFEGVLPVTDRVTVSDPAFYLPGRHDESTGPPRRQLILDFRPWSDDVSESPDDEIPAMFGRLDRIADTRGYRVVETDFLYRRIEVPESDRAEIETMLDDFDPVFQDDFDLPMWTQHSDYRLIRWVELGRPEFGYSVVSGHGDGGYPVELLFDDCHRPIGLRVVFISDFGSCSTPSL